MSAPDTGNTGAAAFGTSSFAVEITRIGQFGMRQPVLNSSHLGTLYNEEYVQGDLWELDPIEMDYWFDPGIQTATVSPPIAPFNLADVAPETITLTWPSQTGQATPFKIIGSGWIHDFTIPELVNNALQASSFMIQFAGGATGPVMTDPTLT